MLEELSLIQYKFGNRGGVLIARKEDMKTAMGGSPDRADAFIYSVADLTPWTGNPYNSMNEGEAVMSDWKDMSFFHDALPMTGGGLPLL